MRPVRHPHYSFRSLISLALPLVLILLVLSSCVRKEDGMDLGKMMRPASRSSVLRQEGYFVWCSTMTRDDDGLYHVYYSRWRKDLGFNAWVTHSEIAHATAPSPFGPYTFSDVALGARGKEYWDGLCTHNPTIHRFGDKYYLYYMGNTGDGVAMGEELNFSHRNAQRIGVAVSSSPYGPWTRSDAPLVDVSSDVNAADALMVSNPSVVQRPLGGYLMVYKAVGKLRPLPFGGPVVHLTAVSDSPDGPFKKNPDPVFTYPGEDFAAEDPFVWTQDGAYWAIVKDFKGHFTGLGTTSLALMTSRDGFSWQTARHPLVSDLTLRYDDGTVDRVERLERPQMFLEDGRPVALQLAVGLADGDGGIRSSFNITVPLK